MQRSLSFRSTLAVIVVIMALVYTLHHYSKRHREAQAAAHATASTPAPAEQLTLKQEAIDALTIENNALRQRLKALEANQQDAEQLIKLKTARLNALQEQAH